MEHAVKIDTKILALLVTIGVLTGGNIVANLVSNKEQDIRDENMMALIVELKSDLKESTRWRYTSDQATEDKKLIYALIDAVNQRVAIGERRLEMLEAKQQ